MEVTETEVFEKYARRCVHYMRYTLSPNQCKWSCVLKEYNAIKWKIELTGMHFI